MWRRVFFSTMIPVRRISRARYNISSRAITTTSPLQYGKARAIELKYHNGTCTLAVPLPLNGFDEERVFSIPPETTVADIITQIEAEDKSIQSVTIRSTRGEEFQPEDTLQKVLTADFELLLNDQVLPVRAPVFTGSAYQSLADDGDLDVRSVAQKSAIILLRSDLERLGKWKISYPDFITMCRERGIPKKQAPEVLQAFHQSGLLFYFGKSDEEDLTHSVFLQPRSILDSYLESIGLLPLSSQLFQQQRATLLLKIQALEPEHVALANLRRELETTAMRQANRISYGLSTSLVGAFGLYFWLSFIHFSWDIMEPVTYFTGFGVSIIGYAWWSITNQEYEYENIYHYVYTRRLQKHMIKAKFDQQRFNALTEELRSAKEQLAQTELVLKKSTHLQANFLHLLDTTNDVKLPALAALKKLKDAR
ncbi:putative calcium uniporter protein [Plasmopara halstedii]